MANGEGEKVMDLYENSEQLEANHNFPHKIVVAKVVDFFYNDLINYHIF